MPVVRVSCFACRSHDQKRKVTDSIARNGGIAPKWVYVIVEDVASSDWAVEGTLVGEPESDDPAS